MFAFFVCAIGAAGWFRAAGSFSPRTPEALKLGLLLSPAAFASILFLLLRSFADKSVSGDPVYLVFMLLVGGASLVFSILIISLHGLNPAEDVVLRNNIAAIYPYGGLLLGVILINLGSNIGSGDTVYTTLIPLGLALLFYHFSFLIIDLMTHIAREVAVERDSSAGIALGVWFAGAGLLLAFPSSGNWESSSATIRDYVKWLPALVLWSGGFVYFERRRKLSVRCRQRH